MLKQYENARYSLYIGKNSTTFEEEANKIFWGRAEQNNQEIEKD